MKRVTCSLIKLPAAHPSVKLKINQHLFHMRVEAGFLKSQQQSTPCVHWNLLVSTDDFNESKGQFQKSHLSALQERLMSKEYLYKMTWVISISSTLKFIVISFLYRTVYILSKRLSGYLPGIPWTQSSLKYESINTSLIYLFNILRGL